MQVLEDADDESNAVEFRNSQKATRFEPEEFSVNVSGTDRPFGVDTTNPNASKLGLPNLLPAIGESGEDSFYDYNSGSRSSPFDKIKQKDQEKKGHLLKEKPLGPQFVLQQSPTNEEQMMAATHTTAQASVWTQQVVELPPIFQQKKIKHIVFESDDDDLSEEEKRRESNPR